VLHIDVRLAHQLDHLWAACDLQHASVVHDIVTVFTSMKMRIRNIVKRSVFMMFFYTLHHSGAAHIHVVI
jgi:hypothetical protein